MQSDVLDMRGRAILQLVVEEYISSAQAVSSAAVLRRGRDMKLSSATIRAVMADLETLGLLWQPHSSAGRIPTEAGLRLYLDNFLGHKLHPWDRTRLDAAVCDVDAADLPCSLGDSLAGLSGQVAVIFVARHETARFDVHVEGASHLVDHPEFAATDKLRSLLRALGDRKALARLAAQLSDSGVRVMLGSEHHVIPDMACVGGTWRGQQGSGAISLLGPARMDYGRLVPLVSYATELCGRYL